MTKEKAKKVIKNIVRIVILSIMIYFIFAICMVISIFTEGSSKDKMQKYESKTARIAYYEKYKDNFNYFVNLFSQSPEIVLIDYKKEFSSCSDGEIESYLSKKIRVCSLKPLEFTDEQKKEIINNFEIMEDLYSIQIRTDEEEQIAAISFYLVLALNGKIHYNYCLSTDSCDSEEDYYENDRGKFEKNKIDDKWSSIYDTLYTI